MTTSRRRSRSVAVRSLPRLRPLLPLVLGFVVIAAACSAGGEGGAARAPFHPDGWEGVVVEPGGHGVYDPVSAGEPLPADGRFRQVLRRDDILPVYAPRFVTADQAGWEPEELVIGVDLEGEARAYPVSFLNRREIVVDLHRGIPTFVTW